MKQTNKNRLLTFLAITGVTLGGPFLANGQDGFGLIQPAKRDTATRDAGQMPPIIASKDVETERPEAFRLPPIVTKPASTQTVPPIKQATASESALPPAGNAPLPFAASKIYQAAYVGDANSKSQPSGPQDEQPAVQTAQAIHPAAQLDQMLPPVVTTPEPVESELPPIALPKLDEPTLKNPIDASLNPIEIERTPSPLAPTPMVAVNSEPPFGKQMPQRDEATELGETRQGYSTAGIPIYSASMPTLSQDPPPIVDNVQASANVPPIVMQDTPVVIQPPTEEVVAPQPIPLGSPPPMIAGTPPVQTAPMQTTPVDPSMPPSMMPQDLPMSQAPIGDQSLIAPPMNSSPVMSDCSSCNGGVAGCQSCGSGGCFDNATVTGLFNSCGSCANARRYFIADALYYDRDDGVISNSNFGSLNNFDWNAGWRFTLGRRFDSTQGREISYMGTLPVDQNRFSTSPTGIITSRFIPADGFGAAQTSGFFNATQQLEAKQTSFHSLEVNRVRWGWDVLKTYLGVRYMMVDDSYTMYSQSITNDQGFFQLETMNHLFGPHIGAELFYDVGYRMSFSLVSKFGVYANLNETDTVMFNNGTQFINNEDREGTISTSYELGLNSHFRLNRQARLRLGYNFLYLGDVASVSDNFPTFLTPSTVGNASDNDEMFFHGVSFGFEIYR